MEKVEKVMHDKMYKILRRPIHQKVWEYVRHLQSTYDIWKEIEEV